MATERAKAKKNSAMAERLRKVKERKRLRKGLPIKSPDEDDEEKVIINLKRCVLDNLGALMFDLLVFEGVVKTLQHFNKLPNNTIA